MNKQEAILRNYRPAEVKGKTPYFFHPNERLRSVHYIRASWGEELENGYHEQKSSYDFLVVSEAKGGFKSREFRIDHNGNISDLDELDVVESSELSDFIWDWEDDKTMCDGGYTHYYVNNLVRRPASKNYPLIKKTNFFYLPLNGLAILLTWAFGGLGIIPLIVCFCLYAAYEYSNTGTYTNTLEKSKAMGKHIEDALYAIRSLKGIIEIDIEPPNKENHLV